MAIVEAIESAVTELSTEQLAVFRQWFADFDATVWDEQFERDVQRLAGNKSYS